MRRQELDARDWMRSDTADYIYFLIKRSLAVKGVDPLDVHDIPAFFIHNDKSFFIPYLPIPQNELKKYILLQLATLLGAWKAGLKDGVASFPHIKLGWIITWGEQQGSEAGVHWTSVLLNCPPIEPAKMQVLRDAMPDEVLKPDQLLARPNMSDLIEQTFLNPQTATLYEMDSTDSYYVADEKDSNLDLDFQRVKVRQQDDGFRCGDCSIFNLVTLAVSGGISLDVHPAILRNTHLQWMRSWNRKLERREKQKSLMPQQVVVDFLKLLRDKKNLNPLLIDKLMIRVNKARHREELLELMEGKSSYFEPQENAFIRENIDTSNRVMNPAFKNLPKISVKIKTQQRYFLQQLNDFIENRKKYYQNTYQVNFLPQSLALAEDDLYQDIRWSRSVTEMNLALEDAIVEFQGLAKLRKFLPKEKVRAENSFSPEASSVVTLVCGFFSDCIWGRPVAKPSEQMPLLGIANPREMRKL